MSKINFYIVPFLLILLGCVTTNTFYVQNNFTKYVPTKKIYIESGQEIISLSSRLKTNLEIAKFIITDSKEDADYILTFNYKAKFDKKPWVFESYNLELKDPKTDILYYKIKVDNIKPEPVSSLMTRTIDDMKERLLGSDNSADLTIKKPKPSALIIKKP